MSKNVVSTEMTNAEQKINALALVPTVMTAVKALGLEGENAVSCTDKAIYNITGVSILTLMEIDHLFKLDVTKLGN